MKRKICVFTGTRAEYGLLKPLMDKIKQDDSLKLQLLVSGSHVSEEFGLTYKNIENDGFFINEKVDISLDSDTPQGIIKSTGIGVREYAKAYSTLKPDILVVLGDRFEALAASVAAMILRIPIAHLHGGETTIGAIDEAIRHSITKMSYLHFVSTEQYRNRVIQLGEAPDRVFNFGAIALDNIREMNLLSKEVLEKNIRFKFNKRNLLVSFHPVTLEKNTSKKQFSDLLSILNGLKNTNIIFTKSNADAEGRTINALIGQYVMKNKRKSIVYDSMGQLNYLSAMQYVDAVVGNSSSGIIEAPSFNIGTINIGDRQKGRICAASVVNCKPNRADIQRAFGVLYSSNFQNVLKNCSNPYDKVGVSKKIKDVLKRTRIENILKKKFYDIDF